MQLDKKTKQRRAQEVADECRELYEEICDLQKNLGWPTQSFLCEKIFVAMHDECNFDDEKEGIRKLEGQVKKMFQRKTWEQNKATNKTMVKLKELRNAIYRTDDYRYSDLYKSDLPPEIRKEMAKESKELEKWLKETDYEE